MSHCNCYLGINPLDFAVCKCCKSTFIHQTNQGLIVKQRINLAEVNNETLTHLLPLYRETSLLSKLRPLQVLTLRRYTRSLNWNNLCKACRYLGCDGGISTFTSPNSRQMLTIVILYAISWIIFVIFFIDEVRRHEISKTYFTDNWVKFLILFASGPFIMIPITIKSIEDLYKDAKEDNAFKEEKQREELRNALLLDHVKGFQKEQRHFEPSYIATFDKLYQTVKDKMYRDIIECLSKITLRRTYRMNVLECEWHDIGDKSKIYVIGWSNVPHLNYFRYANVEQSAEGAWQAYLLSTLWHILPLYWHANYDNRSLIFNKEDLLTPKYLKFVTSHSQARQ